MSDDNGTVRITGRILLGVLGTLLLAWSAWLSNAVLDIQRELAQDRITVADRLATVRTEAEAAHRRIDGVAVAMRSLCGKIPDPRQETPIP